MSITLASAVFSLALFQPRPAQAYVPPSFFVVRMLARKHSSIEDARFKHQVTVYKKNGDAWRTFTETISLSSGDRAQIRLSDDAGNELMTRSRKLMTDAIERPVAYDLLFVREPNSIFDHFKALGLPLKQEADLYAEKEGALPYKPENTVTYARYENRFAVVVGQDAHRPENQDKTVSLWVEKDSFLPLRAVFPTSPQAGMASEALDFRISGYQVHKNFLYPRTMLVFRNGTQWLKIETVDVRPGIGGTLEDAKTKVELDSDTREFVENYFKWVR
jgi:hypothetical protein